jgi:DNA polymerase III delta subunit
MILFSYGTDGGRLREEIAALVARYRAKHGTSGNLFLLDLREETHVHELEHALSYRSFLQEPIFISASHAFAETAAANRLFELLVAVASKDDKDVIVLVSDPRTGPALKKAHKKLWELLDIQAIKKTSYEPLEKGALIQWMQAFCAERLCLLDPPVAAAITARCGNDSWLLSQELAKLCAWQGTGAITQEAVSLLTSSPETQNDVFAMTDALARRDKRGTLRALRAQLNAGADPHYLLSMYAFTVRNLLMVADLAGRGMSDHAIASTSGLHPFVVQKTRAVVRSHNLDGLHHAHGWLATADRATKDGRWDTRDALYDFVLSAL